MMMVNDGLIMITDVHSHSELNKKNTMLRKLEPKAGKASVKKSIQWMSWKKKKLHLYFEH